MNNPIHRLRSFIRRDSRITDAQERAVEQLWPQFGLSHQSPVDFNAAFNRQALHFLEIGFGMGVSLLAAAKQFPEQDFIGVETHKPGVGALLLGIKEQAINNLKVFYGDVIDVLAKGIADQSLDGIQIFFPDPWQKRKHFPRRLIQPEFIKTIVEKLKTGASLHLATDWDDYAKHMMRVLSAESALLNLAGVAQFAERSPFRPILSKFEARAEREGRPIWELQFKKK